MYFDCSFSIRYWVSGQENQKEMNFTKAFQIPFFSCQWEFILYHCLQCLIPIDLVTVEMLMKPGLEDCTQFCCLPKSFENDGCENPQESQKTRQKHYSQSEIFITFSMDGKKIGHAAFCEIQCQMHSWMSAHISVLMDIYFRGTEA